ncbi:putative von Willebrand factor type A domain protein [Paratrimastix pyriformis]|uniref:von Willebrand factor type A domain protein n=1 Tax=Paratrimastix pyriformis TaxID=342808 RepID=A0ABQ8UZ18_9EUKA|nr:putative von Willebrand factor type A domain protein [Paratrimastix pyriformis]
MDVGLFYSREGISYPVPLKLLNVTAQIRDTVAEVTLEQTYLNDNEVPIETVYKFPLDDAGAITGLEVTFGDTTLRGKFEEKQKARQTYEEAVRGGKQASLLEEQRPDIFTASIGNIRPGEKSVVTIHYVTQLSLEPPDVIKFVLPTTIAPRYVGAGPDDVNPTYLPKGKPSPYRLIMHIDAEMVSAVTAVESPDHQLKTQVDERTAHVELLDGSTAPDRDLIVLFHVSDAWQPRALLEEDPATNTVAVMLAGAPYRSRVEGPPGNALQPWLFRDVGRPITQQDIIFVVDRSGSMEGPKMEAARDALATFVKALEGHVRSRTPGSGPAIRFNVLFFGSSHAWLFPEPVTPTAEARDRVVEACSTMHADMGGTELLAALRDIFPMARADRPSSRIDVLLLTDGEIGDTDAALKEAREVHASTGMRLFTVGVGSDVSHHLVRSLANVAGGVVEFVQHASEGMLELGSRRSRGEVAPNCEMSAVHIRHLICLGARGLPVAQRRLENKVLLQLGRALSPSLPIEADWGTEKAPGWALLGQYPDPIPSAFLDTGYVLYAIFRKPAEPTSPTSMPALRATLRRKSADTETDPGSAAWAREVKIPSAPQLRFQGRALHQLAARALIRQWEEDSDEPQLHAEQVVRLSLEAGVMSRSTSLLLVAEGPAVGEGRPQRHEVPSNVPRDYGGAHGPALMAMRVPSAINRAAMVCTRRLFSMLIGPKKGAGPVAPAGLQAQLDAAMPAPPPTMPGPPQPAQGVAKGAVALGALPSVHRPIL